MQNVAVIIPWRDGCPERQKALRWVMAKYLTEFPDWPIVLGSCDPDQDFSRAEAIIRGVEACDADTLIISDADVWTDPTMALSRVGEHGWAVPHRDVHRLSPESTDLVLTGADWERLPLSQDNRRDRRPYKGNETGTLLVIRRDIFDDVPPDRRFRGWGSEDEAWGHALQTLVGPCWRGTDPLVHLWHPPQPRISRKIGNRESHALLAEYTKAAGDRARMRRIVEASR